MDTAFHAKVRERAYHLWIAEGCPDGRAADHWTRAETDLSVAPKAKASRKPAPRAKQKLS